MHSATLLPHADSINTRNGKHRFDIFRAIRATMTGGQLDGIEAEVNAEIAAERGRSARSFFLPLDVLARQAGGARERRDLTLTTGSGAKGTDTDPVWIEALRAHSIVARLGAGFAPGLRGNYTMPKATAGASVGWFAEGAAPSEANPTVGTVSFAPKSVGAYVDMTHKVVLQTAAVAGQQVAKDLLGGIAAEVDRTALNGSGVGAEPAGVLATAGISTISLGTNGGAPTWASIVAMEAAIGDLDAERGPLGFATTPNGRSILRRTERAAGNGPIWDRGAVLDAPAEATRGLPSTLTKGSSGAVCSAAVLGYWPSLVIATWGQGVDVLVDPYTFATSGNVRIVAMLDADIKIRNPESFAVIVDMLTS